MRRAFLSPTRAIAALLLVLCLVPACSANLVELLYVNGCEDEAAPLRGTRGCFAGSFHDPTAMVVLTLRGLHVPSPTTTPLRVVLVPHTPPPLPHMQDALHAPTTSVLEAGHVWECLNLTASNLFPTELFTCQLPSPAAAGISTQMKMNEHDSTWFDVQLFASASSQRYWSGEKRAPTNFDLIANLRRSVEVKMASPHGETNTKKKKAASLQHHPLENLLDASGHVSGMMLGIGGLHDVLEQLYRRAFLTRLPSLHTITNQLELQHVRGVLLHGPPGNGKSLVARGLVQLLRDEANVRTTVINAADVLSKYVGESEKNLKAVFDEEVANDGDGDGDEVGPRMHIIVIDEFEALFRRRGYSNDESSAKAVYDGITNMLLSLMDGVDARNDVLLIGMTNRLDSIDKALLRPGRFEVLLEVPVPDVKAREEIFFIHTQQLRQNAMLPADDWIPRLATQCDGFSGSDIAGVVRSATSYALQRYREVQQHSPSGQHAAPSFMVELQDLERAVVEIHATRAEASQRGLEDVGIVYPDLIDYNEMLMEAMRRVSSAMDRMRRSQHTNVLSLAVVGGQGTGKTFVAHHMLQLLQMIPTKRYISCRRLVEEVRDPAEMVDTVRDALQDASRGAFGAVVLDDLDVLLDHLRSVGHHEATLLHAMYRYTSDPPSGRQHPLDQHADALHDDHGKRVLIWTANSLGALYPLTADVQVPLRTVPRSGVRRVLEAIGLLPKDNRELTQAALRFFPSTLSIRDVLRITDMAVLKLTEDLPSSGEEGADSWRLPFFSGNRTNTSSITTSSTPVVSSLGRARAFAAAVDDVLQEMHIQDLDRFSRMSSTKGSYDEGGEEGEAAEMLW